MKQITLTPEQLESALQYAMGLGAWHVTKGPRALSVAKQAWSDLKSTPHHVRMAIQAYAGRLP